MNTNKIKEIAAVTLIAVSALGVGMVSAMAFLDPQGVMDLVQVKLENNDAYSSIRGVYGGVGSTLLAVLLVLARRDRRAAMSFLAVFWGMYALSRLMTIGMEGTLGAFGNQWLVIESVLSMLSLAVYAWMGQREGISRIAAA